MITIPQVLETLVKSSPYLDELLQMGIINYSALARNLKLKVEQETMKTVQTGAIIMALKRLSHKRKSFQYRSIKSVFKETPDVIVRSNLVDITVKSSDFTPTQNRKILRLTDTLPNTFLTVSRSVFETTIICGRELKDEILGMFDKKSILAYFDELSSITIRLTRETTNTHGVYYMILKSLAWEGINLVELVSTYTELTLVIKNKEVDRAFTTIKNTI